MRIIITGGNSGVGKATAAAMAAAGHEVVIACRSVSKGRDAVKTMSGDVKVAELDLADLASVRKFADTVDWTDVLVNNAGVLGLPLTRTADGFEAHMGTNHLGHFALTCLLGDRIHDRVVTVASSNHALARMHFDDLNWRRRRYRPMAAYNESKLANMLFVHELVQRGRTAYLSDPGMTDTGITKDGSALLRWTARVLAPRIAQTPEQGARSTIQAISTDLPNGAYIAPGGLLHQWGKPRATKVAAKARDSNSSSRLWQLSVELTGCDW
jgi:NAD(P)-dependent dehydrogenase (short-subunit alcohol dehydrogenase family)